MSSGMITRRRSAMLRGPHRTRMRVGVSRAVPIQAKRSPKKQPPSSPADREATTRVEPCLRGSKRTRKTKVVIEPSLSSLMSHAPLTDEDLLEILTAPSPVWWEDHPDYSEDPIYLRSPDSCMDLIDLDADDEDITKSETTEPSREGPSDVKDNIDIPIDKQTDKKFMNKRGKLENVLGNIKKLSTTDVAVNKKAVKVNKRKGKCFKISGNSELFDEDDELESCDVKEIIKDKNAYSGKGVKSMAMCSESSDEDPFSAFRNEDVLRDLENMDIPVESDSKRLKMDDNDPECHEKVSITYDKIENTDERISERDETEYKNVIESQEDTNSKKDTIELNNKRSPSDFLHNELDMEGRPDCKQKKTPNSTRVVQLEAIKHANDDSSIVVSSNKHKDKQELEDKQTENVCEPKEKSIETADIGKETKMTEVRIDKKQKADENEIIKESRVKIHRINKNHLMAVYKTITDKKFKESTVKVNAVSNEDLKTTTASDYQNKEQNSTPKSAEANNIETTTTNNDKISTLNKVKSEIIDKAPNTENNIKKSNVKNKLEQPHLASRTNGCDKEVKTLETNPSKITNSKTNEFNTDSNKQNAKTTSKQKVGINIEECNISEDALAIKRLETNNTTEHIEHDKDISVNVATVKNHTSNEISIKESIVDNNSEPK